MGRCGSGLGTNRLVSTRLAALIAFGGNGCARKTSSSSASTTTSSSRRHSPSTSKDHVPAKYKERVPRVIRRDDGTDAWLIEGQEIATFGLNAVQGRPRESWGADPASFDQVRPGTFDVHERIRDMNVNGVLASLNFPSWPGLGGQFFVQNDDTEFVEVMIRAYNDWHIDEWCGAYPGRFIPLALSGFVLGDEWMAGEIHRVAEKGCHAVSFHSEPHRFGMADIHGPEWDQAWQACNDIGTVVVFHFGGVPELHAPHAVLGDPPRHAVPDRRSSRRSCCGRRSCRSSRRSRWRSPRAASAGCPTSSRRPTSSTTTTSAWTGADFGDKLPSQVFREHVQTCFIDDYTGLRNRHQIGVDMITWEATTRTPTARGRSRPRS